MRPIRLIVMAIAIAASGSTAMLARSWVNQQQAKPESAALATIEVVVAARDLPAGAILQMDDLRFDRWPAANAARMVTRQGTEDPRARFAGQVSRRDFAEGEPLTAQALRQNSSGKLAAMLEAGKRAVSVPISNASSVSGFVTPGDQVDVVLAADLVRTQGGESSKSAPMVRFAAETVLSGVKVLAIDQNIARAKDGGAQEGKTATLEVTPKQAEILAAASMLGSLSLVLRGADADQATPASPFTPDTEASRALSALTGRHHAAPNSGAQVIINRAGQITAQSFGR